MSYPHIYEQHNYCAEPFIPIGMESLVREKPQSRRTFAEHCRKRFVFGTSFDHYRGWEMWMVYTRATRISATIFHKYKYISNPTVTPADKVIVTTKNLVAALKGKMPDCLHEYPLAKLTSRSRIFSNAAEVLGSDRAPYHPIVPEPAAVVHPEPRQSPRLTSHVDQDGRIKTAPSLPPATPFNPPIPQPQYIQNALDATARRWKQNHNSTLWVPISL